MEQDGDVGQPEGCCNVEGDDPVDRLQHGRQQREPGELDVKGVLDVPLGRRCRTQLHQCVDQARPVGDGVAGDGEIPPTSEAVALELTRCQRLGCVRHPGRRLPERGAGPDGQAVDPALPVVKRRRGDVGVGKRHLTSPPS